MGYQIDDQGYSCASCGERVWSREEAEDCERKDAGLTLLGTSERVRQLKTALRLATERWRVWRAVMSWTFRTLPDGSPRPEGTNECPQEWRERDQRAYDRAEAWNDRRLALERKLGRAIRERCRAWNTMALDR